MAPTHHPSAQALADVLSGDCSPGLALLVHRHVAACPRCAAWARDSGTPVAAPPRLAPLELHAWAPGVEIGSVSGSAGLGEWVYLVRLAAGRSLPAALLAEVLVLEGALVGEAGIYGDLDYLSIDEGQASLRADPAAGCLCLATASAAL